MVLGKYKEVMTFEPGLTDRIQISIDTVNEEPIHQHSYRPQDALLGPIKDEVDVLVDQGIIRKSCSPWSTLIIPVKKLNRKIRICVDLRKLISITKASFYYMLLLEEIVRKVGPCPVILSWI